LHHFDLSRSLTGSSRFDEDLDTALQRVLDLQCRGELTARDHSTALWALARIGFQSSTVESVIVNCCTAIAQEVLTLRCLCFAHHEATNYFHASSRLHQNCQNSAILRLFFVLLATCAEKEGKFRANELLFRPIWSFSAKVATAAWR
jgi:hypothetical protein